LLRVFYHCCKICKFLKWFGIQQVLGGTRLINKSFLLTLLSLAFTYLLQERNFLLFFRGIFKYLKGHRYITRDKSSTDLSSSQWVRPFTLKNNFLSNLQNCNSIVVCLFCEMQFRLNMWHVTALTVVVLQVVQKILKYIYLISNI